MASTIVATPSAANANSYVTIDEADAFFGDIYGYGAWSTQDDTTKAQLLITATRHIDTLNFSGNRLMGRWSHLGQRQPLKFPRVTRLPFRLVGRDDQNIALYENSGAASTDTSIVVSGLINHDHYPDDYFNLGSILVVDGDLQHEIRGITDFVRSTGTFTVEAFSGELGGEAIVIIPPVVRNVKQATYMQAWYLLERGGSPDHFRNMIGQGVYSYRTGDVVTDLMGKSGTKSGAPISVVCPAATEELIASGWYSGSRSVQLIPMD